MQPDDDDKFLQAMGLEGLQGEEKRAALEDILYVLDARVTDRMAELLTEQQAAEFDKFDENTDNEEIAKWLEQNVPNRPQIIEEEAQKMRDEAQAAAGQAVAQK